MSFIFFALGFSPQDRQAHPEPAVEELQEELPGLQMKVIRGNSIGIPIEGFQFRFDKRPKSQLEKYWSPKEEDAQQSLFNPPDPTWDYNRDGGRD